VYEERASRAVPGAVLWQASGPGRTVLPDGCMDLLWADGRLLVAGPDTGPHPAGEVRGDAFTGIRFAPGAAPALFGVPAHALRDQRVDLAELAAAPDPVAGLEELAARRAAGSPPPDPLAAEVAARLRAGAAVADIARAVGLGPRQLHRRSLDAFGYGPRTLGRILRLRRALALADAAVPYAEIAATAGYADQAHLAREVRALAGTTLGGYASGAKSDTPQPSGSRTTA
jgi:AraC-like DNA-binding protein